MNYLQRIGCYLFVPDLPCVSDGDEGADLSLTVPLRIRRLQGLGLGFIIDKVSLQNRPGHKCRSCRRKVLPFLVLVAVCVIADALDDNAGDFLPDAGAFHLESDEIVRGGDAISVFSRLHDGVA